MNVWIGIWKERVEEGRSNENLFSSVAWVEFSQEIVEVTNKYTTDLQQRESSHEEVETN